MATLTIKDIARICGVGTSTVSRAINDDPGINKDTKARILQTMEEYNFVPNNAARNLKILESNTIALIIKGMENQFFQSMYAIFAEELKTLEYTFLIQAVAQDDDEFAVAKELIKEKKLKGIIFLGGLLETTEQKLDSLGIPFVRCTGATQPGLTNYRNGSSISIDDVNESYRAISYLIEKGHKDIAIISSRSQDQSVGQLRIKGYRKALEEHNIKVDEDLILYTEEGLVPYTTESGYVLTKKLIESGKKCSAIFTSSDVSALGAYKAIYDAGKKIPEDYSVLGFDGIDVTNYYTPGLTTVEQPVKDMVKASITQLSNAINGLEIEPQILFEGKLIERESVKK